jgi:hypothetical protein
MAYPNQFYFPQGYQQNFQGYPQNYQQTQQPIQQPAQQQMQIQNGGFVCIRGEQEAREYPIAAGTSITFKDETAPYIYTKTMGFSQLDLPQFEKYRLVKEDSTATQGNAHTGDEANKAIDLSCYVKQDEFEAITAQIEGLKKEIEELKAKKVKKEVVKDD